jgi:hypothetical protein
VATFTYICSSPLMVLRKSSGRWAADRVTCGAGWRIVVPKRCMNRSGCLRRPTARCRSRRRRSRRRWGFSRRGSRRGFSRSCSRRRLCRCRGRRRSGTARREQSNRSQQRYDNQPGYQFPCYHNITPSILAYALVFSITGGREAPKLPSRIL